ncbi:MAG: tetratricopeptide repeat protein [Desulfobacteraceae bacterium]|jgi:tetratricopeptide (TPR) repeat protein
MSRYLNKITIRVWIFYCSACLLFILSGSSQSAFGDIDEAYKTTDKAEEQKEFVRKLIEDDRKVDLAIENTKMLIDKSRSKPYMPELYMRLAELYIEKSRIVYFIRKGNVKGKKSSAMDKFEYEMLKNKSLEIYQRILDHYPDFEDRDKVYFFMAHEQRELGDIDEMVKSYRTLIKDFPKSSFIPEAYLLLGDYFFAEQDLDSSTRHYEKVLDYPESPAIEIARYKLAWCFINNVDCGKAIKLFEEAVEGHVPEKELDVDTYQHVDVRLESLIDMAFCYPEHYKKSTPEEALKYFQKYSWSRQSYGIVLDKLAYRYFVKKNWKMASALYRELCDIRQDPEKLLEYCRNIFECIQAMGKYENADRDVALIVKALRREKYSVDIDDKQKEKDTRNFEVYARELITHLHEKARATKSGEAFKIAGDAYKNYLEFFDDSPSRSDMQNNYAEVLFSSGQYLKAGKEYEKIVDSLALYPEAKKDKLYSAVISYYNALKNKEDLNYYDLTYARQGMRATGNEYASAYPNSPVTADVLFNVAWVAYDAGMHDQAIEEFTGFVDKHPYGKSATAAVHLVMDMYNVDENYKGLTEYGNKILSNPSITDAKLKTEIAGIVKNAESKIVSTMTLAAVEDWDQGKEELLSIATEEKSSVMGEQALKALIVSAVDKGDYETLFTAGDSLVKEFPESDQSVETMGMMIDISFKIGQFRMLADYLEKISQLDPKHKSAAEFLSQAGKIREGLGQYETANIHYQRLLNHPSYSKNDLEEIIFAIEGNALRTGDQDEAINVLKNRYASLGSSGKIHADADLAWLNFNKNHYKDAYRYLKKAAGSYKTGLGKKDPAMNDAVARMVFTEIHLSEDKYYSLKLGNKIDNKIVKQKTDLLTDLEKRYQKVINYQSTEWALKACYQTALLNYEFAKFLKNAPLPELSDEQKSAYIAAINEKASGYQKKGDQYMETCVTLSRKWEICDPGMVAYYMPEYQSGTHTAFSSFNGKAYDRPIGKEGLHDRELKAIYDSLYSNSEDFNTLLELAMTYVEKRDFGQAMLVAGSIMDKVPGNDKRSEAMLYTILGICHLYTGEDKVARDEFKQALKIDKDSVEARINLAGLYSYYGHAEKAASVKSGIKSPGGVNSSVLIHPKAGEYYNAGIQISKK